MVLGRRVSKTERPVTPHPQDRGTQRDRRSRTTPTVRPPRPPPVGSATSNSSSPSNTAGNRALSGVGSRIGTCRNQRSSLLARRTTNPPWSARRVDRSAADPGEPDHTSPNHRDHYDTVGAWAMNAGHPQTTPAASVTSNVGGTAPNKPERCNAANR